MKPVCEIAKLILAVVPEDEEELRAELQEARGLAERVYLDPGQSAGLRRQVQQSVARAVDILARAREVLAMR